jgi:prepilin-type N-terminal cleavage/methylation domain-containing protein
MQRGFTLVELSAGVIVLAILMGVALWKLPEKREDALCAQTKADLRVIFDVAELYRARHGKLPAQTDDGHGPGAFAGLLDGRLFNTPGPMGGGGYGWMTAYDNLAGLVYIDFYSKSPPRAVMQRLDKELDDGNLNRGLVRIVSNRWAVFGLEFKK